MALAKEFSNYQQRAKPWAIVEIAIIYLKHSMKQGGMEALQEISRKKPILANRVDPSIEEAAVNLAIDQPAYGPFRVSNELKKQGILVSPGRVRWHNLNNFKKRSKSLAAKMAQEGMVLTASQLSALEKGKATKKAPRARNSPSRVSRCPRYLLRGYPQRIGRIYQQTCIDTYPRVATAKLYTEKTALTACGLLNDKVLPFFSAQSVPLVRLLTDRGTEYCGKLANHAYQRYLRVEDTAHSSTKAYSPQTNDICERFHKTLKGEFCEEPLDEKSILVYRHYNRYCYGKTPMQTFLTSKQMAIDKSNEMMYQQERADRQNLTDHNYQHVSNNID